MATVPADWRGRILEGLTRGDAVRQALPDWGRVHIDRPLPFLCVYRRPMDREDKGTGRLVLGEASYLRANASPAFHAELDTLVAEIAAIQGPAFGSFLLLELWAGAPVDEQAIPGFRVCAPRKGAPSSLLEAAENALLQVRPDGRRPDVSLTYAESPAHPPGMAPLDPASSCEGLEVLQLGLEVRPIYRRLARGPLFPIEHSALHRALSRALKQIFHAFSLTCTRHRPKHFYALGRRAMTKVVSECDERLAKISGEFDLLLHVSPVNSAEAWEFFRRHDCERIVKFLYRPRAISPGLMKRRLFDIPIEDIEDPTLAAIFEAKRDELDRQLTLVADRNTPRFLLGSRQLFGDVSPEVLALADRILATLPNAPADPEENRLSPREFAQRAEALLARYREQDPSLTSRVAIRDDVPGILVSKGNFLIGSDARVSRSRVDATLAHEIGTHVLTHHNGRHQPFRELDAGMAGYEAFQEGLAVLAEYLVGDLGPGRLRVLAGRSVAVRSICDGADFIETYRLLARRHGFARRTAFNIAMRVYRGGGYTKDQVYLQGLVEVLDYLARGKEMDLLYLGKLAASSVELIEELRWREVLAPPRLRPLHLENEAARARLAHLRAHPDVMQLAGAAA